MAMKVNGLAGILNRLLLATARLTAPVAVRDRHSEYTWDADNTKIPRASGAPQATDEQGSWA